MLTCDMSACVMLSCVVVIHDPVLDKQGKTREGEMTRRGEAVTVPVGRETRQSVCLRVISQYTDDPRAYE